MKASDFGLRASPEIIISPRDTKKKGILDRRTYQDATETADKRFFFFLAVVINLGPGVNLAIEHLLPSGWRFPKDP